MQQGDCERVQNVLMLLVGTAQMGIWSRGQIESPDLFEFTRPSATCLLLVFSARAPRGESSEPRKVYTLPLLWALGCIAKWPQATAISAIYIRSKHTLCQQATANCCPRSQRLLRLCCCCNHWGATWHSLVQRRARWPQEHLDESCCCCSPLR